MKRVDGGSKGSAITQQVNITLDAHWWLVVRQAAVADGVSVPDLLRPVVITYLKRRLKNEDLAEAVARIEKIQRERTKPPGNVSELPVSPPRVRRTPTNSAGSRKDV